MPARPAAKRKGHSAGRATVNKNCAACERRRGEGKAYRARHVPRSLPSGRRQTTRISDACGPFAPCLTTNCTR